MFLATESVRTINFSLAAIPTKAQRAIIRITKAKNMPNSNPLVSVVLPVYNEKSDFLKQAVDSILEQTFSDLELVIINDGSTQEVTQEALANIELLDKRVKLHNNSINKGLTKTLNIGISLANGKLICRQDSDDWSEPTRIAKQVYFLNHHPSLALVGTNCMLHQENGKPLWTSTLPTEPQEILKAFLLMNPFTHGSVCFRRSCAEDIGGYREQFAVSQDYDFFWRLCEHSGGANLGEVLYHHRRTATSISAQKSYQQTLVTIMTRLLAEMRAKGEKEDFEKVVAESKKNIDTTGIPNSEIALKRGDYLLLAGYYSKSLQTYLKYLAKNPKKANCYLKLLRWGLFILMPSQRKHLFGH